MSTPKSAKSSASTAVDAVKQVEEVAAAQPEVIEPAVKVEADVVEKAVETVAVPSKTEAATKVDGEVFKGYEDILQFNRDNFEALVKSSTIVARGVQDLSKTFAALAQDALEESVATGKALAGVRTIKDVIDLSSSLAKANLEKLVSEGSKISQLSSKLAEEAFAPLSSRVGAAVDRLTRTAA
ncbi:TIGR01841 family phasin [Telmatospirillum sp.]|uniref:phasin family protein n=1 Tax=Telmatospirillum sp. TaxID=2079197 RepID=UPI0028464BAD|nr:TIGR01841 family phasin [Telmatospirillum sp.]MDR3436926.1 TIGR01841 family phasin [Telmatospirillum sp.]